MKTLFTVAAAGLLLSAAGARAGKLEDAARYTAVLKTSGKVQERITAAEEIGKLAMIRKSYGKEAIPYLMEACTDKNPGLRAAAADALGKSYSEEDDKAVALLTRMMKDDGEMKVRVAATRGLGAMGPMAKEALPTMRELMAKEDKKSPLNRALRDSMAAITERKK
jgi:HEAT repeat protein